MCSGIPWCCRLTNNRFSIFLTMRLRCICISLLTAHVDSIGLLPSYADFDLLASSRERIVCISFDSKSNFPFHQTHNFIEIVELYRLYDNFFCSLWLIAVVFTFLWFPICVLDMHNRKHTPFSLLLSFLLRESWHHQ